MPKGFKVSWKDDAYATFAEDMHALLDTCVSIRQSNAIKDVCSGLQKIYDAMPAGEARDALSDVIKKLSDIQTFIDDFVKNKGAKSSAINRLYKSAYSGDTGEGMYRSDIQEMKIYLRDKKVLFFQGFSMFFSMKCLNFFHFRRSRSFKTRASSADFPVSCPFLEARSASRQKATAAFT